ncbi:MAG TPA: TraB/GumN family protein, partial [Novosphingobium sp.]|nr:TraB/GumN family protein [Novosphingobium sp.]
ERALTKFGLPVEAFDRFEPWYAAVALTALPLAQSGYSPANGVDERIGAEMKRLGRPRIGLETAEAQFRMFDSLPLDVQKHYLGEVLDGIGTINEELAAIVREWTAGDPAKLAELLNADEDDPRMVKALLTDRNKTWASWLQQRLAKPGTVFVAVGAGHLAGKDSVQDVLARAGVKVTRVQ